MPIDRIGSIKSSRQTRSFCLVYKKELARQLTSHHISNRIRGCRFPLIIAPVAGNPDDLYRHIGLLLYHAYLEEKKCARIYLDCLFVPKINAAESCACKWHFGAEAAPEHFGCSMVGLDRVPLMSGSGD